jgi:hypothetical protein
MALTTDEFTERVRETAGDPMVEDVAEGVVMVRFRDAAHTDIGLALQHTGWTLTDVWFGERKLLFRRWIGDVDLEGFGAHGRVRAHPNVATAVTLDCRDCGSTFRRSEVATPTFGGLACPDCGSTDFG